MCRSWSECEKPADEEGEDGDGHKPQYEFVVRFHRLSIASPSMNAATTNSVAAMTKSTAETAFLSFRIAVFTRPPSLFDEPNGSQPLLDCGYTQT